MLFVLLIIGVVAYVIGAIFLMKVLRRAGFEPPVAAWVPLWNTASMVQISGIAKPWIWVAIVFGGSFVSGLLSGSENSLLEGVGWVLSIAVLVIGVILTVWMARAIQAGLGLDSAGGVVLAVLIPLAWIIWMGIRADKAAYYDAATAYSIGATFPLSRYIAPKTD